MGVDDICYLVVILVFFCVWFLLCEEVVWKCCGGKEKYDFGDELWFVGDGDDVNC